MEDVFVGDSRSAHHRSSAFTPFIIPEILQKSKSGKHMFTPNLHLPLFFCPIRDEFIP